MIIIYCLHCKEQCTAKLCKNCATKEQRVAMCKANREINPKFACKFCKLDD